MHKYNMACKSAGQSILMENTFCSPFYRQWTYHYTRLNVGSILVKAYHCRIVHDFPRTGTHSQVIVGRHRDRHQPSACPLTSTGSSAERLPMVSSTSHCWRTGRRRFRFQCKKTSSYSASPRLLAFAHPSTTCSKVIHLRIDG